MAVDLSPLITSTATFYGIYWILAISFNLEYGYAGQPNLGKVLFYSIGAYASGLFTANVLTSLAGSGGFDFCSAAAGRLRIDFAVSSPILTVALFVSSLAIAAVLGGFFGYLASYPALKLKGDFLAIVLVVVGEIGRVLARTYAPITCSVYGLDGVVNPFIWMNDPNLIGTLYAILVLSIAFLMHVFTQRLVNAPYGRLLRALRDDELVAKVLGKNTPRTKGGVLVVGSAIAAIAGSLYAFFAQAVFADDFIPAITFTVVAMVILGGVSNQYGSAVGALAVTLLDRLTRASVLGILGISIGFDITYLRYTATGALMILILMFRPQGLIPEKPIKTPAVDAAKRAIAEGTRPSRPEFSGNS